MSARFPDGDSTTHVSLRDVAEHANVSFQTVSKVLRGDGRVAAETRQRILDAASELGYVPNTLARSLATRRTQTVGFIASGLASYVLGPMMKGAEREARSRGYLTIFTLIEGNGERAERLLNQLIERRVDGVVNAALTMQNDPVFASLLRRTGPTVSLFPIHEGGVPLIGPDLVEVGAIATSRLTGLGHRRIATIAGAANPPTGGRGQISGWERSLKSVGVEPESRWIDYGQWSAEGGYAAMLRLLERAPEITAVFAQNDHMAIGAMKALAERGLRVPEDFAIVGCDDIELAPFVQPALSTVQLSFDHFGATAMRVLVEHLTTKKNLPERVVLPVELIVRDSCGQNRGVRNQTPSAG